MALPAQLLLLLSLLLCPHLLAVMAATPYPHGHGGDPLVGASKKYEGSSSLVDLRYHMGPVLSSAPLRLYVLWYGRWDPAHQAPIRDFLLSLSDPAPPRPSVAAWWATAALYTDQTLVTWELWKERNARIFQHQATTPLTLLAKIREETRSWCLAGAKILVDLIPGE